MKFLIVKTSSLGDILHAFPVVQYIKDCCPEAQIDWVAESQCAELVQSHPEINNVFLVETKSWRKGKKLKAFWTFKKALQLNTYDAVFDLQGNIKSGLITFLTKSARKIGFGKKSVPEWPNLLFTHIQVDPPAGRTIREDYLALAQSFFGKETAPFRGGQLNKSLEKILVCPGSAWPNKQMDTRALIDFLKKISDSHFYLIWGNETEKEVALTIQKEVPSTVLDKMTLTQLQNFIGKMDLVIAMDSLPLHLSATTNTPTYSVFGPSWGLKYKPPGEKHGFYQGSCPYGKTFEKRCPILRTCKTGLCMKSISGEALFESFQTWKRTL